MAANMELKGAWCILLVVLLASSSTPSSGARYLLEFPQMPAIPSIPGIPAIPAIPEIPSIPSVSQIQQVAAIPSTIPQVPAMPSIPDIPAAPSIPGIPSIPSIPIPSIPSIPAVSVATGDVSQILGSNYSMVVLLANQPDMLGELNKLIQESGATLFAPSNDAFNNLNMDCIQQNQMVLENLLSYHVVMGSYPIQELVKYTSLPTGLEGNNVTISYDPSTLEVHINNDALVIQPDMLPGMANLTVHGINSVLIPPMFMADPSFLHCGAAASASSPPMVVGN